MAGIHREAFADRRWTGPAFLAGAAPWGGAGPALGELRRMSFSRHAVLPAMPLGDIRVACGRTDRHHRDVVYFSPSLLRWSRRAVHGDPGAARLRRPAVLQSGRR